jgi:hypothetical protein
VIHGGTDASAARDLPGHHSAVARTGEPRSAWSIPGWIITELGEARCRKIAQEVLDECYRAKLSKAQAIDCALSGLEAVAGTQADGSRFAA